MTVNDLVSELGYEIVTNNESGNNEVSGGFVGDLLSVVMGKAKEGDAWITIQSHFNIVAVATLVDMACIIIAEGFKADEKTVDKANEEDIAIIQSKDSSYEIVNKLVKLGIE